MKKFRFYAAISLIVQSISFAIIFLVLYNKKRSLAKTFAALSVVGGIAGAWLLICESQEKAKRDRMLAMDACCDMSDEDFMEDDVTEEDINCTFEEEPAAEESIEGEDSEKAE
ncbi:MAG: hypothetical protein A2Y17_03765 [Clostridiales bacterium GWF2_38_85]|nr:MAG: hypothetical protein A2Y17_03765 [Clostridiales bacterium GWF2_38_85]HBL85326.1 hypothetical protein [Clostridiales bacterium]